MRTVADKNFQLLKADPRHPSLHFKRLGKLWSARVGEHHRALGHDTADGVQWFWIGSHADYDQLPANNAFERTVSQPGPRLSRQCGCRAAAQLSRETA
ncbi:hypothetical protein [Usitatibacter palustris]|uniref:ParE family toxin-like protein n=1 Tax=Usitatibacter palustris TaxID=2732487 RepID=UPI003CCDE3B9